MILRDANKAILRISKRYLSSLNPQLSLFFPLQIGRLSDVWSVQFVDSERFQYRIIKTRRKSKVSLCLMRWECGWLDYCIGWKMRMGLNIILFQSDVPLWSMLDGEFDILKWVGFYTLTQNWMEIVVPKWNICIIQPTKMNKILTFANKCAWSELYESKIHYCNTTQEHHYITYHDYHQKHCKKSTVKEASVSAIQLGKWGLYL